MKPHTFQYDYKPLLNGQICQMVKSALAEDLGAFETSEIHSTADVTAQLIPADRETKARLIAREQGVLCGCDWVNEVFRQLSESVSVDWKVSEGEVFQPDQTLCVINGPARIILTGERTAMNFLQTLSGTASITHRYVEALEDTNSRLLDTRKTLPGFRLAQKYAVKVGGGQNHRIGLFDAFLIKENHIMSCGGIKAAIEAARAQHPELPVEIEVESLKECQEALSAGANIIMLDNFSLEETREAVKLCKNTETALEASGNITLDTILEVAQTGVDYISTGAITKHVQAIDLSLRVID